MEPAFRPSQKSTQSHKTWQSFASFVMHKAASDAPHQGAHFATLENSRSRRKRFRRISPLAVRLSIISPPTLTEVAGQVRRPVRRLACHRKLLSCLLRQRLYWTSDMLINCDTTTGERQHLKSTLLLKQIARSIEGRQHRLLVLPRDIRHSRRFCQHYI